MFHIPESVFHFGRNRCSTSGEIREGRAGHGCTSDLLEGHQAALPARRSQKSSKRPLSLQHRRAMMALAPATVQCMPARLSRAPMASLHPASTTPDDHAKTPRSELRIAHPVAVAGQVVDTLAGLLAGLAVGAQFGQDRIEPPGVQLVPAGPLPHRTAKSEPGAVDGLGDITQMPLGMVDVDRFRWRWGTVRRTDSRSTRPRRR